ncbi:hypothetical protein RFN57_03395 [Streptomyces violaceochromogenes]|uniref:Uncharacterized protein n=2 Tax=Streptomyces violaceochromogenes TaxID=67377 RepID=A0ABU6LRU7_9ACTN|nr:hypothetical protein [Streptomyces violaceochromogenes]
MKINFTPDSSSDIGSGYEKAWQDGRVDLATISATDLRYGWFAYQIDFKVGGHAFLSSTREPLVDIMFTLAYTLQELRAGGSAEINFTENSYVIHLKLVGNRVRFTSSHRTPAVPPECPFEDYTAAVRAFVASGVAYLVESRPALAENPALDELRALMSNPAGGGTGNQE